MENKRNWKQTINTLMLVLIVIAVAIIFSSLNHAFASKTNIMNIVRQVSVNGILAVGMTLVCLTGGIDLSVGSILGYAGIWTATFAQKVHDPVMPVPVIQARTSAPCAAFSEERTRIPAASPRISPERFRS